MKILDVNEKSKVEYCIPTTLRDEQIKINITKVKGRVEPFEGERNEPIAIVTFGPSLNDSWEEIKKFKYVMSCSGAHKFLIEHGIIPTWHLDLDPREHKYKLLGQPQQGVQYLIASTVHPKYLDALEGYNVKLWHIFANEGDAASVLPRGEWSITGGSSVGLRCMTLARFMGFKDQHIFGMDGSFRGEGQTHTSEHPNAPKAEHFFTTEYKGKKYLTNPSLLHCAKETMNELNQMKDVKATFYGDGLTQALMKDYVPAPVTGTLIAFNKPELISEEYKELNHKLHRDNPHYGMGGARHKDTIIKLSEQFKTTSILDYGSGKGMLAKSLPFPIWEYDPAIPEKSASPNPADIVICSDVLEHIEPDKLQFVLDDLKRCVKKVGFFVISTRKAVKTYANGKNAHLIVQGKDWWNKKLSRFFDIGMITEKNDEIQIVLGVKTNKPEQQRNEIVEVDHQGRKVKFHVPNDTIKWRCETIFKKEPITIKWIESFKKGETMIDIGANMGGYSMLASKMGVKVFAFEPEAENYALLQRNILLNESDAVAYCAAITDKMKIDKISLSQVGVGGSCHSFGGEGKISQGCVGLKLDDLNLKADHIKIDVDGQEPNVIAGAEKLLSNGVKSVLIEVNENLPIHKEMVSKLIGMGFSFDQSQVDEARRKDGPFKGCAEYLFVKKSNIEGSWESAIKHVVSRIKETPIVNGPFDYLYVENIFPQSVYDRMINELPDNYLEIEKTRGTRGYPKRFTAQPESQFWLFLNHQLINGLLASTLIDKFNVDFKSAFFQDVLLIRDEPGYSIAPHTDSLNKVITGLFYLPQEEIKDEGTGIFVPKEKGFICKKGKHYNFEDFKEVYRAPFKPNSALFFKRTDNSFHGVKPCKNVRDVLLYNINKTY